MTKMQEYVVNSERTLNVNYGEIANRLSTPLNINLLHATMGLSTEANEMVDLMKKVIFYGKPLDTVNLIEEMGDMLFYMSIICRELNISLEDIAERNTNKLRARYPEKFTETAALNRDLNNERKILEK